MVEKEAKENVVEHLFRCFNEIERVDPSQKKWNENKHAKLTSELGWVYFTLASLVFLKGVAQYHVAHNC